MSGRITFVVVAELLSDAVLGSGYSIPGGEDSAVVKDENGLPYIPGTAMKGLLRESVENWLFWTGKNGNDADEIFGREGWNGEADGRRLVVSRLTLAGQAPDPEACFGTRTFTSLEDGVARKGTLRTVSCAVRGLQFEGTIGCAEEDGELIINALSCVKWLGAHRNRGFGKVEITAKPVCEDRRDVGFPLVRCIRYVLRTKSPVIVTDLGRSGGNSYDTLGLIPGSAVRGLVIGELAEAYPEWFNENRTTLLSNDTRFLDAMPNPFPSIIEALPSIKGFYEDKEELVFESVVPTGKFTSGHKRAKLGTFCSLTGDTVSYWSAATSGITRISRGRSGEDSMPFQVRYIDAGQTFVGYICLKQETLAPKIAEILSGDIRLGADRYEGFGECSVESLSPVERPGWIEAYGYEDGNGIGKTYYLLAVSPFTMTDCLGEPCGMNTESLSEMLGVGQVTIEHCAASVSEYGGYNRTWQCREPMLTMYDRGSVFKLISDRAPALEAIRKIEMEGLGVRVSEGMGQVLFIPPERFESIVRKSPIKKERDPAINFASSIRRAKIRWIEDNLKLLSEDGLSRSQLGGIQAQCESAMAASDTQELFAFLDKNLNDRGAKHGSKYNTVAELVKRVCLEPLAGTIRISEPCRDNMRDRLQLLCDLFDHSRRGREEK